MDRADATAPGLRAAMETARRDETETAFAAAHSQYCAAMQDFLSAWRTAVQTRAAVDEIVSASLIRFPGRAGAYMAFPPEDLTLDQERLNAFKADADRALAAERRRLRGEW